MDRSPFSRRGAAGQVGRPGYQSAIRSEREDRIKEAACLMSNTTGGRCQAGGTDFSLPIDGALEDLAASYSLGYVPDRARDGNYHRIEVRATRRGLRTRHREGYADRSADDRLRERLAAALWFGAEEDLLGVELAFEEPRPTPGERTFTVPIQVTVPARSFALLPAAAPGVLAARGRILLVHSSASGRSTTTDELPVSFEVAAEKLTDDAQPAVYAHRLELRLRPGDHKLAVGVWDDLARRGSFLGHAVTVGGAGAVSVPGRRPR